jgi:hypothetical protein
LKKDPPVGALFIYNIIYMHSDPQKPFPGNTPPIRMLYILMALGFGIGRLGHADVRHLVV